MMGDTTAKPSPIPSKTTLKYEACDPCRIRKVRCEGGLPCAACKRSQSARRGSSVAQVCVYNLTPAVKPKYLQAERKSNDGTSVHILSDAGSKVQLSQIPAEETANYQTQSRKRRRDGNTNGDIMAKDLISTSINVAASSHGHADESTLLQDLSPPSLWPKSLPPRNVTGWLIMAAYEKCTIVAEFLFFPKLMFALQYGGKGSRSFLTLIHALCLIGAYGLTDEYLDKILSHCHSGVFWQEKPDVSRKEAIVEHHLSQIVPAVLGIQELMSDSDEELITMAKAMFCMTMFFHADGQWPRLPMWTAMTMRTCILLGLNRPGPPSLTLNLAEDVVERQRSQFESEIFFWIVVSMEQFGSILTNISPTLALEDIFVPLPSSSPDAAWESKRDLRHPEFLQITKNLSDHEPLQLYFKVSILGERIMRFMRRNDICLLDREAADFKKHHDLLMTYLDAFPRQYLELCSLARDLTPEERRQKQYYFLSYTLLNTIIIVLHSPFYSFDSGDVSMLSSYRSAQNIFAQMNTFKENFDSTRFTDNNFCIGSFALAFRILAREMMIKRLKEMNGGEKEGESSFSVELQCRSFLSWLVKLSQTWKTASTYTPRLKEFLEQPELLIPSQSSLVNGRQFLIEDQSGKNDEKRFRLSEYHTILSVHPDVCAIAVTH
ncbi:hypothetical protein BT69DRAFT_1276372 [Atractiella rhizophila]|nr:hypothetical protein BT69DRAFT_1276372 [Atractiella rhizophila]